MTVAELVARLAAMPADADVRYVWDGAARSEVTHAWLAQGGRVILSDGDSVYYDEDRPAGAPSERVNRAWGPDD